MADIRVLKLAVSPLARYYQCRNLYPRAVQHWGGNRHPHRTTGSISLRFAPGDLIIPVAAIRADGTSDCYIDRSFPAVANLDVVNALGEACEHLGFRYGYGIMYSPSSLYIGQGRKLSEQGYWPSSAQHLIDDLRQARVTNIDTDSAGQFVVDTSTICVWPPFSLSLQTA